MLYAHRVDFRRLSDSDSYESNLKFECTAIFGGHVVLHSFGLVLIQYLPFLFNGSERFFFLLVY